MTNLSKLNSYYRPSAVPISSIPHKTLGIGLNAWWQLDDAPGDGTGVRLDSHGNCDLNENSISISTAEDSEFGTVIDFAGSALSNLIVEVTPSVIPHRNGQFSFAFWMKPDVVGTEGMVLFARANASSDSFTEISYYAYWSGNSTKTVSFAGAISAAQAVAATTTETTDVGEWAFIYTQYNAATRNIGISLNNGALVEADVGGEMSNSTHFMVGRRSYHTAWDNYFNGKMSRFGCWGRLLTAAEITWLSSAPRNYSDLEFA